MKRYKVLSRDAEIDAEVALLQGAMALDAAGEIAEYNRDIEGLLKVSALWMKFSEGIQGFAEKMQEQEEDLVKMDDKKIEIGFCAPSEQITIEENENV